jgi:hypothetical protein
MGLDNGIVVKTTNEKIKKRIKKFKWCDELSNGALEIAYWRKCWNIRCQILGALRDNGHIVPGNDSNTKLNIDDINSIIKIIRGLNRENWDTFGGCAWTYEDLRDINRFHIKNLKKIKRLMKYFPDELEVSFYDSY